MTTLNIEILDAHTGGWGWAGVIPGFGAALIEVMTKRPVDPSRDHALPDQGVTLWAKGTVLSGHGDELVQVTRKNLRELALD
jgi:hypothetical protein